MREATGLSQQEVAVRADLSMSLVAKLEQGKKGDPRASTLLALASALGVKPGAILEDLFPPAEAELIAELIRRDLPYYDATLSREFIAGMTAFLRSQGVLDGEVPYEQIVATQFAPLWKG